LTIRKRKFLVTALSMFTPHHNGCHRLIARLHF